MKKLVFVGFSVGILLWLAGCGSTYKSVEIDYLVSPYAKYKEINLEIISPKDTDQEELKNFKDLIVSALQKRGISVVDSERQKLIVEILSFYKESKFLKFLRKGITGLGLIPGPFAQYTSNAIEAKVSIKKGKEKAVEFKEFQDYKESIHNWEDLKRTVANRIADAVYFAR